MEGECVVLFVQIRNEAITKEHTQDMNLKTKKTENSADSYEQLDRITFQKWGLGYKKTSNYQAIHIKIIMLS